MNAEEVFRAKSAEISEQIKINAKRYGHSMSHLYVACYAIVHELDNQNPRFKEFREIIEKTGKKCSV